MVQEAAQDLRSVVSESVIRLGRGILQALRTLAAARCPSELREAPGGPRLRFPGACQIGQTSGVFHGHGDEGLIERWACSIRRQVSEFCQSHGSRLSGLLFGHRLTNQVWPSVRWT